MRNWLSGRAGRAVLGVAFAVAAQSPSQADACGVPPAGIEQVLPPTGSLDVSTASSLFVARRDISGRPPELSLEAGGVSRPLPEPEELGRFYPGLATLWQYRFDAEFLAPSTEHVLFDGTATDAGSGNELTRFTTAAGYDKAPPSKVPAITAFALARIRYPLDQIGSGNCVFAEYHGYVHLEFTPAELPNTSVARTLYRLSIAPKTGGSAQTLWFTGAHPFTGRADLSDTSPINGEWRLELDPTREYCANLVAYGDGDLARLPAQGESSCASVQQYSAPDAPAPPNLAGTPKPGGGDGGSGQGDAGTTSAASASDEDGGCSLAKVPGRFKTGAHVAWALALLLAWRRRSLLHRVERAIPGTRRDCHGRSS